MLKQILNTNQHRPWPLPNRPWSMTQTWNELLFAHWPVSAELLKPLLPDKLTLDTYNNQAWIGVVPFTMNNIRLRGLPKIPYTSAFHELNVRTYVKLGEQSGVYFFSLDAANRLAVEVARTLFHLPYRYAHMDMVKSTGPNIQYYNKRQDHRANPAEFKANYRPVSVPYYAQKGTLEYWLTERYCLYTTNRSGIICRGDIHHKPWSLQDAQAEISVNTMITATGLPQIEGKPLLHYSKCLEVLIWSLDEVES